MPTQTNGSVNIATLDSAITSNLCSGIFSIDILPSTYIGAGADNVMGANVRVTNPYGVVIKQYPTSGYDIYPPLTDVVEVYIPTQAGNYQYGQYKVEVELIDADGTVFTISKNVKICVPDANNKTRNYGSLSATINGICKEGKVYIIADGVPNYNGAISDSQVNDFTLEYPTSSGLDVLETTNGSFSTNLFEGVYKFKGTICGHYSFGDNIFANVNYKLKREKNIRCLLDETCIYAKLSQLDAQTKSDCTEAEKADTQNVIIGALRLVKTIEVAANSGFDASDYIDELEDLLGCVCTCNCADGTPVINTNPSKDFIINGCNVTKTTVGLTDTYDIDNYAYVVAVTANGNAITISAPILADCTQTQTITFNISAVYAQVKNQIVNATEYNFWASIINRAWNSLDIACVGISQTLWDSYTFAQRSQAILNQLCVGGVCNAQITDESITNTGANVTKNWNNDEDVYEVAAYLDGVLQGTVLSPVETFTFIGAADGDAHTWTLVAKCTNGSVGNSLNGTFTYYGCPAIATPIVSLNSVPAADCPYDLTALVSGLAAGITAEWHNLNNTNTSSLVADPTNVSDGTYFVFGKDSNGCYSLPAQVIVVCTGATNCSAPQTLLVESITGGFRIRFQGAAFPPPLNSYTVKRRLTSDPDTSGSYTTIGTPTWNATVNRWEILDATPTPNTSYTYRAISNCTSTAPYMDYVFANISCPTLTLTPTEGSLAYSFTGVGGGIDKYEVKIYEADGTTLVHTDTIVPAFSNPITGTFLYLDSSTAYKVRVSPFIGTYYKDCPLVTSTTSGPTLTQTSNTNTGVGGTRTQIAQVGDYVAEGNIFSVEVYSHIVSYTALAGDTPTLVAIGLRDAINAESEADWDSESSAPSTGTTGFPPTATASGAFLTVVLNYGNAFIFFAESTGV
jgi:hypothetical protein